MDSNEDTKYLEDKPVSDDELSKLRESLPKEKKLMEVTPKHFRILERMRG